jgi:hypothetical protein
MFTLSHVAKLYPPTALQQFRQGLLPLPLGGGRSIVCGTRYARPALIPSPPWRGKAGMGGETAWLSLNIHLRCVYQTPMPPQTPIWNRGHHEGPHTWT